MNSRFDEPDYQLRWPRSAFVAEAARLLNNRGLSDWDSRCEHLPEEAFVAGVSGGPLDEFREIPGVIVGDPWGSAVTAVVAMTNAMTERQKFLRNLMDNADSLKEDSAHRRPYWSQRMRPTSSARASYAVLAAQFVALVHELDELGYFDKRFGKDCVDDPRPDPAVAIAREIGVDGLWPLDVRRLADDLDLFCDVVEVLHDFIARPARRWLHSYADCGWHHGEFSIETGRMIYRWRVNRLLEGSEVDLQLADGGEDVGRMVEVTDAARGDLIKRAVAQSNSEDGDQVRHAVALFRARGADKQQKRSAVIALAGVLEQRRQIIKSEMLSKDEGALFEIANKFNLRHQDQLQRADYDPLFLDWVFWWYLATIELTDRMGLRSGERTAATPA